MCDNLSLNKNLPPDDSFERRIWKTGRTPAGVDEVGRGPLAGPVVAAAVILPEQCPIVGLNDSKRIKPQKREILFAEIKSAAISVGIGMVDAQEIDRINILQATLRAMEIAVVNLSPKPDYLLIDGDLSLSLQIPQEGIIKGDSKSFSIAAASIVAKVTRDRIMEEYHKIYPQYNFKKHKGYPTREHLEALEKYGPCPLHRRTFKGVT